MDDAVAKALHAVRHHLAGGGFLSDLFSGPDYLSTGEVASPTNWGDPESAADFFKADRALRLAREVQASEPARDTPLSLRRPVAEAAPRQQVAAPPPAPAVRRIETLPGDTVEPHYFPPALERTIGPYDFGQAVSGQQVTTQMLPHFRESPGFGQVLLDNKTNWADAQPEVPTSNPQKYTLPEAAFALPAPQAEINRAVSLAQNLAPAQQETIPSAADALAAVEKLHNAGVYSGEALDKAGEILAAHNRAKFDNIPVDEALRLIRAEGPRMVNQGMPVTGGTTRDIVPLSYAETPAPAPASQAISEAMPATGKMTARIPEEPHGTALTKQQADYVIRTIAAETSGKSPEETQAIASVILNRINSGKYGASPEAVLFAKRQFEPWMNPAGANYPMKISPKSQRYSDARNALEAAMAGEDITGGATHFWGPKAQYALGREAPSWGRTGGVDIGETRFHKLERAEGGEVEDPSLVDRAINFISQFNPIGSAEAASLPKIFAKVGEHGPIQNVKIGKTTGVFQETPTHLEISSVRTPVAHRGQGGAGAVMQDILQMADEVGKPARLIASPLDKKTDPNKLVDFYRKHGFELTGEKANLMGDPWMERPTIPKERAEGGLVDDALHVVREHHADGEAVGQAPVATDNSERVRAAESAANLAKQIQTYEASMASIRQQPQDIQSMTHAPEKPRAPISVEALGKNREFGSAPYDVAGPLSSFAQGAYDMKTLPLYMYPPTAPLGMAIDTAEGMASGSPTQVAMGALGGPLKVARNVIAPLAVATGVTASDEAEAAKLSKLLRVVSPEDRLMLVHNLKSHRLADIEKLGGLPVPSTAVIKPSQGFTSFGDITMVAPKEMAQPSRTNPMYAADVYTPRFPSVDEDLGMIFKGYTPSGKRRYVPLTLENVVKEMKGNVRGGEGFNYGVGTIRSGVAPQFKSIEQIQNARDLIQPRESLQPMFDIADKKFAELADKYYPHYKYSGEEWRHQNDLADMLREAGMGKWYELFNAHKSTTPPELRQESADFLNYLKKMPTEYFEGKPQRGVRLDEFRGAVVPGDIAGEQADILRRMGVERLEQYDPNSPASRIEALQKFGGEQFAEGGSVEDRALMLVSKQA